MPEQDIAKQDVRTVKLAAETMYKVLCRRGFPLAASAVQQSVTAWIDCPNAATCRGLRTTWEAARTAIQVSSILG